MEWYRRSQNGIVQYRSEVKIEWGYIQGGSICGRWSETWATVVTITTSHIDSDSFKPSSTVGLGDGGGVVCEDCSKEADGFWDMLPAVDGVTGANQLSVVLT